MDQRAVPASALEAALAAIDDANRLDPNTEMIDRTPVPKELHRGRAAHRWLLRLDPAATDAQQLAARAHHLRRWTRPRDAYPSGRAGYLRWRAAAKEAHAAEAAELLESAGVAGDVIGQCRRLILKEGLVRDPAQRDPAVQAHEDALCLVFFEFDALELAGDLGGERTATAVRRTLDKMSDEGRRRLLGDDMVPIPVLDLVRQFC